MASLSFLLCITFLLSLFFSSTLAHMYLSSVVVGGQALPEGECVRLTRSNYPIPSVTDSTMTCGHTPGGTTPTAKMCPVAAGSQVGLQWWWEKPGDMVVDPSHEGPCLAYLAKNDGKFRWFKIYEDGWNNSTKEFCVDRLIKNKGLLMVTIPSDVAPGNYLLRGETIALHAAHERGGAQPYVGCAELTISGSGNANPNTVSLPGAYSANDPGIFVSIYYPPVTSYVIPGPAVYGAGSSSGGDHQNNPGGKKSSGLSGGAIAAIVIILLLVAIVSLAVVGIIFYRKNGNLFGKTLPLSWSLKLTKLFG